MPEPTRLLRECREPPEVKGDSVSQPSGVGGSGAWAFAAQDGAQLLGKHLKFLISKVSKQRGRLKATK